MDGNFQQRHNVLASKDNPEESQYPKIFIPPSQVQNIRTAFEQSDNVVIEGDKVSQHAAFIPFYFNIIVINRFV